MRRILVKLALSAVTMCLNCAGHAQPAGEVLLRHAAQCLAAKGFFPRPTPNRLAFGYLLDEETYPGKTVIYVVSYRNSSRSSGLVFTVFLATRNGSQVFDIQNNADFKISKSGGNGVAFTSPPLGGIWTQEHLVAAINQVRRRPSLTISTTDLPKFNSSIKCEAYTDK